MLPSAGDCDTVVNPDIVRLTTVCCITGRKVGIAITPGRDDFEVFTPHGRHHALIIVKFGRA